MNGQTGSRIIAIIIVLIIIIGGIWWLTSGSSTSTQTGNAAADAQTVDQVVTSFGAQMQNVSVLAPTSTAMAAIDQDYSPYVAPELLTQWENNPSMAPGRLTSSPWPDHIIINSTTQNSDGSYTVTGDVAEITSVEETQGGVADEYPVTITLQNRAGQWLITDFQGTPSSSI